jgi:TrmH family RNA methyltransferase
VQVRIILVEPHEAGNVGAAARAMKNFAITDMCIVGDRPQRIDDISEWWSKGAEDVVRSARRSATLEEALADVHLSVATTAVRGRHVLEQLTPADVAQLASSTLGDDDRLGIVFGREQWGLTGHELSLCQRTAVIRTWPEFPTMNLAQSIAIFCYELSKNLRPASAPRNPPPGELMHELNRHARRLFDDVGFFTDKNPDRLCAELTVLAARATLSTREASTLLALIRRIEKRLGLE